jgi:nitroreductase
LAARALGIGGTITTLHAVVDQRARELFGLPEDGQIVYALPLGYPKGSFGTTSRKPLDEVVSYDRW